MYVELYFLELWDLSLAYWSIFLCPYILYTLLDYNNLKMCEKTAQMCHGQMVKSIEFKLWC